MRNFAMAVAIFAAIPTPAHADVKFTKLSDTQYVVHHRKNSYLGAEAKAMKTAYKEAASICVAAGYTHLEIKEQNVGERHYGGFWGGGRGASADVRIKLYMEPDEEAVEEKDLIECQPLSDPKKVKVAKKKLARESS